MSTKKVTNDYRINGCDEVLQEVSILQPVWESSPGSFIWVKTRRKTWWPGQVVGEGAIVGNNKPSKKLAGDVLVRLYGSYRYLYVNPITCQREFEIVLKQNGGNYSEILNKALEKDIASLKSKTPKSRGTKSKAKSKVTKFKKKSFQNGFGGNRKVEPLNVRSSVL